MSSFLFQQSRDEINHKVALFIEKHTDVKEASVLELLDYDSGDGNQKNNGNKVLLDLN
jgi:hypothetical protein